MRVRPRIQIRVSNWGPLGYQGWGVEKIESETVFGVRGNTALGPMVPCTGNRRGNKIFTAKGPSGALIAIRRDLGFQRLVGQRPSRILLRPAPAVPLPLPPHTPLGHSFSLPGTITLPLFLRLSDFLPFFFKRCPHPCPNSCLSCYNEMYRPVPVRFARTS